MIKENEEIKYHNQLWYYKTYNKLIDKCIQMESEGYPEDVYTEVHHILPKCIGGTNKKDNLVRMPVRYHIVAHMLLASAFPDNKKIVYAVNIMFISSSSNSSRNNSINRISTRLVAKFREDMSKQQIGSKLSEIQKQKISNSMKKFRRNSNSIISVVCHDENFNVIRIYKCINDASIDKFYPNTINEVCNNVRSDYAGYKFTYLSEFEQKYKDKIEEFYKLSELPVIVKQKFTRTGEKIYNSKQVIGPDGTIYGSIEECSRATKHIWNTLTNWIKNKPEKGYRYYIK